MESDPTGTPAANEDYSSKDEVVLSVAPSGVYEIVYVDSRSSFQAIDTTINLSTPPTLENIQKNHANRAFIYSGGLIAACAVPTTNSIGMSKGTSSKNSINESNNNNNQSSPSPVVFQHHSRGVVPHGKGKLFYQDTGEFYEGEWVFGKREGKGLWIGPKIERKKKESATSSSMAAANANNESFSNENAGNAVSFLENNSNNNNNNISSMPPSPTAAANANANQSSSSSSLLRAVDRPSYDGEWRGDKKHGKGTEHFPDGRVYVGNFKNDVCTGIGCLTFPNGDTYRGLFNADGVPHDPKGEYSFANGDVLSGAWVEGKRHGTFSVSFASSSQHSYQAIFVNDQSMGITCLS
jgi:hypothetical protein